MTSEKHGMVKSIALSGVITLSQTITRQVRTVKPPLTFTIKEEGIYLARCPEMKAIGWGETMDEAIDELADEMWDFADVLMEAADKDPSVCDPSLPYARHLFSLCSPEEVREFMGL